MPERSETSKMWLLASNKYFSWLLDYIPIRRLEWPKEQTSTEGRKGMGVAEATERGDWIQAQELEELRAYRRQMEAMWDMIQVVTESVNRDFHIQVGSNALEVCCPTCLKVVGILEASAAVMRQTSYLQ